MDLRPGERFDRYTLVEPLGEGGQGRVWKIVDPRFGVVRALKLFDLRRLPASAVARAKIEAEAVNKVADHPAIVPCHDVLSPPGGLLGLVFDIVRGQSLAVLLDDARLGAEERRAVLGQLASALAHVHARGILHRDLKPDNVLVTDAFWSDPRAPGGVKLVDFGIASMMESPSGLTVGAFIGTVAYLPPEVLLPGRWPAPPPPAARDVFAFGVLAWELIAGGHPAGLLPDAPDTAYALAYTDAALGKRPWPPPGSPGDLAEAIAACLTLDPERRPADGAAIERSLLATTSPRAAGRTKPHRAPTPDPEATREDVIPPPSSTLPPTSVHARTGSPRTPAPPTIEMPLGASPPGTRLPSHRGRAAPPAPSVVSPIPTPPTPAPRGKGSILAPLAAGLGAAIVAGVLTHLVTGDPPDDSSPIPPPPPPSPTAVPREPTRPSPTAVPREPTRSALPCCSDGHACKSGHACTPGPCPSSVLPKRGWYLRLSGAAHGAEQAFPDDLARTHPYARVCVRGKSAGGEPVCAPITKMAATLEGDRAHRARVLTSDLEGRGVEIRIEEGTDVLAEGASASNPDGLQTGTLCSGLRLYVGPRETATYIVRGYLDEDDGGP